MCLNLLTFSGAFLGCLAALCLPAPLPASAALPCKDGTISTYQNGSIASCVIYENVDINTGVFSFSCLQEQYIYFDDKGRLKSCVLSSSFDVMQGSSTQVCLPKSWVSVSITNEGRQSASCGR
jgi:hypothetical protein